MCRHLAYVGPAVSLKSLLIDPPYGLYRQAWAPRMQRHGTVNADGFGIGWYAAGDPVPARYRRAVPIWGDASLPDLARVTRSSAVLAAVRDATVGTALGEAAAAPFASGSWLFSHNGVLAGWPTGAATVMAQADECDIQPPITGSMSHSSRAEALLALEAMTDSAFLWLLILERLQAGAPADVALAATIEAVEASGATGRFNFLLTDGRTIVATTAGDTLWYRRADDGVTVASEPSDDEPGWTEVPDRQLLFAMPSQVTVRPLSSITEGIGIR